MINALRQYMEFYDQNKLGGPRAYVQPGHKGDPRNEIYESGARRMWAERMAEQDAKTPRAPDAYDLQQQANSQANSLSTMRNASRTQDVQDMDAMQRFMPKQQAAPERYDDEGLPVGRNYGRQLNNQRMNSAYIPNNGEERQLLGSQVAGMNERRQQQSNESAMQGNYFRALIDRMNRPAPDFFGGDMPRREHGQAPTMQREQQPDMNNYFARLLRG